MSHAINGGALRREFTVPTLVVAGCAALAHWLALRHGAADPTGGSAGFWFAFFGPCVFSVWLTIEQVWHRTSMSVVSQWVTRQLVVVPSLTVLTAVFGLVAVGGVADTGHAAASNDYSGPVSWLIQNLAFGALLNLAVGLMVSIAGLFLVLLPAGVWAQRRQMRREDPAVSDEQVAAFTIGALAFIAVVAFAFVVPTLFVLAHDQSGAIQIVLRVVGGGLGVLGLVGAFKIRSSKRSVVAADG